MAQEGDVASRRWWVDDCDFVLTGHPDVIKFIDDQARLYNHGAGNLDPQVITDEIPKIAYIAFGTCQQRWTNTHFLDPVRWDESAFYHGGDPVHLSSAVIQQGSEFRVLLAWTRDQRFVDPMNPEAGGTCRYWHLTRTTINGSSPSVEYDPEEGVDSVNSPVVEGETYEYRLFTRPDLQSDWYEIAWPETVTITEQNVAPVFVWLRSVTTTEQFWQPPMTADEVAVEFGYYGGDLDHAVIEARMIWPNASCDYAWRPLDTEIVGHRITAAFTPVEDAFINSGCIAFRLNYGAGGTDYTYPGGNEVVLSTLNNRLAAQYFAEYLMNPSSPTWQTQVALKSSAITTNAEDSPYHGAAFDGVLGDNAFAGVDFPMVPVDYDVEQYQTGMRDLLNAVRAAIGSDHLMVINAVFSQYHEGQDAEDLDGVMIESLRSRGPNWLRTATHIRDSLDAANVSPDFPVYIYSNAAESRATPLHFLRDRIFELATYFTLRDHPGTDNGRLIFSYRFGGGGGVPTNLSIYPEVTLDLGAPLQDIPPDIEYYPTTPLLRDCDDTSLPQGTGPLFTRVYERGLVAVNIDDEAVSIDFGDIYGADLPATLYVLGIDARNPEEISAGGVVKTALDPWDTSINYDLEDSSGVIFLTVETATPQAAQVSESAAIVGVDGAKLAIKTIAGGPLTSCRVFDSSSAQLTGGVWLELKDDGNAPDDVAGDQIYSGEINTLLGTAGQPVMLDWQAENDRSLVGMAKVKVPIITAPESRFMDYSFQTDDLYDESFNGEVTSSLAFDANGDTRLDLLVSRREADPALFKNAGNDPYGDGIPQFVLQSADIWFTGSPALSSGYKGMAAADVDNDGDLDPLLAQFSATRLLSNESTPTQLSFSDDTGRFNHCLYSEHQHANCAAWADLDHDGRIDLFLGRSGQDAYPSEAVAQQYLFINRGDYFEPMPLAGGVSAACYAATWGDIDADGDPDLVMGNASGELMVFRNTGFDPASNTNLLVDETQTLLVNGQVGTIPQDVVALSWLDLDGTAGLDLAVGCLSGGSSLVLYAGNNSRLERANSRLAGTSGGFGPLDGFAVLDFDLNGWQDLLCLPAVDGLPTLLANGLVAGTLVDVSPFVELGGDRVPAVISADFNDDGDPDLYLARHDEPQQADRHFYFRNERPVGAVDPPNEHQKWVKIALEGHNGTDAAIGARVAVNTGGHDIAQVVDGGSGRGSQRPGVLEFPLGDYQDTDVPVTVTWPNGYVQTQSDVPVGESTTIVENGAWIRDDQIISSYSSGATGTTFVFQWAVEGYTESSCAQVGEENDRVYFLKEYGDQSPCHCGDGIELTSRRQDVTVTIWWDAANQLCRHRLEWTGGCCSVQPSPGCQYKFRVETDLGTGGLLRSVTHDFHSIRACAKVLDPPPDPNNP